MRIVPLGIIFVDQQSKYKTLHVNFYLALNCIHSWLLIIDCYCSFLIGLWKLYDNKWPYWFIFNINLCTRMAKWIHYFTRKCLSVLLLNISVKTCNYRLYVNYVTCKHKHCWTKQTLTVRTCTFFWVWIRCRRYRSILLVWNMRIVC